MNLTFILFSILAVLAIASAVVTIATKHPVRAALALVFHFFMLAGIYLTLQAQFVAVMQILVYAGAIMVLVVFVIMLLNLGNDEYLKQGYKPKQIFGVVLAGAFSVLMVYAFVNNPSGIHYLPETVAKNTTAQAIGKDLYTNYLVPFEAIGVLLTATIVGAVVLAKRKINN